MIVREAAASASDCSVARIAATTTSSKATHYTASPQPDVPWWPSPKVPCTAFPITTELTSRAAPVMNSPRAIAAQNV